MVPETPCIATVAPGNRMSLRTGYIPPPHLSHIVHPSIRVSIVAFFVASLFIISSSNLVPLVEAEDADLELVPEPRVHETHEYNVSGDIDGTPTDAFFVNERWMIDVTHGDVMTLIMARNITQDGIAAVDYTNNIHYYVGGKLYIAQFMIMELVFEIGGYEIHAPLTTCSDFELEYSPTLYDGTVPTFDCNITFEGIQVYSLGSFIIGSDVSAVDLTLVHHIRGDWNSTRMKIEALLDFGNTRFFNPGDNNNEFNSSEPFTAEIRYMMMLANPEDFTTTGPVIPSRYTNTSLEYNLTLDDGTPLTVSKLDMRDEFTIYNASGARSSVGYSYMEPLGGQAYVTHGFPNMTYMDTQSMKSDPEITIYHDRVTDAISSDEKPLWILMPIIAAVAALGVIVFVKKRRTR